jgi:hypothetical protein
MRSGLKLSDAFEDTGVLGIKKDGPADLELIVKVYNINRGHNEEKVKRSRTLEGYSVFVGKVREYEGSGCGLEGAMKGAISWCISHDILKDFLESNASEVMNMLMTEWNWDDAFAVQRAEGLEEGLEKGREERQKEIARNALAEGLSPELVQKITGLDLETIGRLWVQ